jgi:two-component system sensor histidine kinase KdpD
MTRLVSDSIQMARIGSAPISIKREPYSAVEIISSATDNLRGLLDGRKLNVEIRPDLPAVDIDATLTELALRQILNNALKYSPGGSEITIDARRDGNFVLITVADLGQGIAHGEEKKIFDKFYRASDVRRRIPGTGLGLSITREIIESQGGVVLLKSEPGRGASFTVTLPIASPLKGEGFNPRH